MPLDATAQNASPGIAWPTVRMIRSRSAGDSAATGDFRCGSWEPGMESLTLVSHGDISVPKYSS
jgi:hypothetical protein